VREEFGKLNERSYPKRGQDIDLDWYLEFLNLFNRIFDFSEYQNRKLSDTLKLRNYKKFIL
jgi:hypothetical protein